MHMTTIMLNSTFWRYRTFKYFNFMGHATVSRIKLQRKRTFEKLPTSKSTRKRWSLHAFNFDLSNFRKRCNFMGLTIHRRIKYDLEMSLLMIIWHWIVWSFSNVSLRLIFMGLGYSELCQRTQAQFPGWGRGSMNQKIQTQNIHDSTVQTIVGVWIEIVLVHLSSFFFVCVYDVTFLNMSLWWPLSLPT